MKIRLLTILVATISILSSCTKTQELTGTVALLFPQENSARWEKEFTTMNYLLLSSGFTVYAGSAETVQEQVKNLNALKGTGVTSIVFVSVDPQSPEIAQALATLRNGGVKIICYDRLQMNTPNVDLYIVANSQQIGQLQAAAFDKLPERARIEIMSGSPNDRNATELFNGAWSKIRTNVEGGKNWTIPSGRNTFLTTTIGSWSSVDAGNYISQLLNQYYADNTMPDAILCPNDAIAQKVIEVLQKRFNTSTLPVITGQDNTEKSRELIADGLQTMTVDKNIVEYINYATDAVFKFQNGGSVNAKNTTNNGSANIPTIEITPKAIYEIIDAK